jgi:hypothetical protein
MATPMEAWRSTAFCGGRRLFIVDVEGAAAFVLFADSSNRLTVSGLFIAAMLTSIVSLTPFPPRGLLRN